jgi:glycosyltransferase involved in cell wall biosynthesis
VKDWEAKGWITHLGSTTDVRPYIADSDCIVLPSYREGLSRSLMEAASMARPIITTDVVGCREVVDHEVNGFLCQAMDAADLADQMIRFLELRPEVRREMGEAGRRKVLSRFDVRDVVRMYKERVNALMSAR